MSLRLLALLVAEAYLAIRYVEAGAEFHYLLHGFLGVAAGLVVWTLGRALWPGRRLRPGRRPTAAPPAVSPLAVSPPAVSPLAAAAAGRVVSALPDMLFIAVDLPHATWMDVFLAHIGVHLVPLALVWAFGLFALAVGAATAALLTFRRSALAAALLGLALAAAGMTVRAPLPRTLEQVRERPGLACLLPKVDDQEAAVALGLGRGAWRDTGQ